MDCPSCGRSNASECVECEFCQALLVEVFSSGKDDPTDPIQVIGGRADRSTDTDALLRSALHMDQDDAAVENQAPLQRLPRVKS